MKGKPCGCGCGALMGTQEVTLSLSLTPGQILGPNPNRHALLLSSHATEDWAISTRRNPADTTAGIRIPNESEALYITAHDFGNSIKQPLFAVATGNATVTVIEVYRIADLQGEREHGNSGSFVGDPWNGGRYHPR